jgi:hypothetical protein
MKNKKKSKIWVYSAIGLGLILFAFNATAQDLAFRELKNQGFTTLYFYPSTLRMLGKVFVEANAEALNTLKSAKVIFTFEDDGRFKNAVADYIADREKKGYEMLAEIRNGGFDVKLLQKDENPPISLFYFNGDYGLFAIEIVGKLTPTLMQELMTLDIEKATSLFGIAKIEDSKADSPKMQSDE